MCSSSAEEAEPAPSVVALLVRGHILHDLRAGEHGGDQVAATTHLRDDHSGDVDDHQAKQRVEAAVVEAEHGGACGNQSTR